MATSTVVYRYFCLYHPTIRIQRLFWKRNHVKKKYVKNLELINRDKKKKHCYCITRYSVKSNLQGTPVLFSKITRQSYDQSVAVYVRNKFVDLQNCSSICDEHRSRDDRRIIIRRP